MAISSSARPKQQSAGFRYLLTIWPAALAVATGLLMIVLSEPAQHAPTVSASSPPSLGGTETLKNPSEVSVDVEAHKKTAAQPEPVPVEKSFFDKHHILRTIVRELGFALVISAFTWMFFDFAIRNRAEGENERRLKEISRNVLHAVLGQRLGRELVEEIGRVNFDVDVVRSFMAVSYSLRNRTYDAEADRAASYVELESRLSFEVENVTSDPLDYPVGTSLPDPMHPRLREITRVTSISARKIGAERDEQFDFAAADAAFAEMMKGEPKTQVPYVAGFVTLQPGERMMVTIASVLPKEEEDSELLEMSKPTQRIAVTVQDHDGGESRFIRVKSVRRNSESVASEGGRLSMTIASWTLPHQGIYLFWKKLPKGAVAEIEAQAEAGLPQQEEVQHSTPSAGSITPQRPQSPSWRLFGGLFGEGGATGQRK
ncbi:MAG: hypothetical protein Q7T61_00575 [Caulobacter sp.]|nr:hypothetical protein [Caulobacter sp.]